MVPLDSCVADTQGAIGYALQQNLYNYFAQMGLNKAAATVVTQVEVNRNNPAFQNPSKPIGRFMDEAAAMQRRAEYGWDILEDAGRGWRRVVALPKPVRIVEEQAIKDMIAAVIDKDYATALLAGDINADLFIISTGVEKVALNFGKPNQTWLDNITAAQAQAYLDEGTHFAKGSMSPKIQACLEFLERGGKKAIINPENIERAVAGETGTHSSH